MIVESVFLAILYALMFVWMIAMLRNAKKEAEVKRLEKENALRYRRLMREWAKINGIAEGGDA